MLFRGERKKTSIFVFVFIILNNMHLDDHLGPMRHPHHKRVRGLDKNSNGQEVFSVIAFVVVVVWRKGGQNIHVVCVCVCVCV